MNRHLLRHQLNSVAGVLALTILGVAAYTLWIDYRDTWQEAEKTAQNMTTTIARDLNGNLEMLDLSLKGAIEGLRYVGFEHLPHDLQYRMVFDRSVSASLMASLLVLNEAGGLIMDAGPVIVPRTLNLADRDYFTVQKENSHLGLYVSRPYRSRIGNHGLSVGISRRLQHPDGRFAGVVVGSVALTSINSLFKDLRLGRQGTINLFRGDGVLLTRHPFNEGQIGQDFSGSPQVQRLLQGRSGTFESLSPIDGVHRIISFERLDRFPLVLTLALSVDEVFDAWKRKAWVQSTLTGLLCSAVVGLTALFQRELHRRTKAETKLRRIARTDDLTGLPNRRAFRETLAREWRQAIRSGSSLALLYVDVDCFKHFNDHYGHGRGDEVLRAVATTLDANIRRPRDIATRYGGEEFTILLPETDQAGACMMAEKIRHAVIMLGIEHKRSPLGVATVSIGVAAARPSRGAASAALLEAADGALYQAKAAGRNAVHGADPVQARPQYGNREDARE